MTDATTRYEFDIDGSTDWSASFWDEEFVLTLGLRWDDDQEEGEGEAARAPEAELPAIADDRNDQGVWMGVGGEAACSMSGPLGDEGDLDSAAVASLPDSVDLVDRAARIVVRWPQPVRTCRYLTATGSRIRVSFEQVTATDAWLVSGAGIVAVGPSGELAALDGPAEDQDADMSPTPGAPDWMRELHDLHEGLPFPGDETEHTPDEGPPAPPFPPQGDSLFDPAHQERATHIMLRGMTEQLERLARRGVEASVLLDVDEQLVERYGWTRMVNPMSGQGHGAPDLAVTWAGDGPSMTVAIHAMRPTVPFRSEGPVDVLVDDEPVAFHHQQLEFPEDAGAGIPEMHQLLGELDGAWIQIDTAALDPRVEQLALVRIADPTSFAADLVAQAADMREQLEVYEEQVGAPAGSDIADARDAIQEWIRGVMSNDPVLIASRTDPDVITARGGAHAFIEQVSDRMARLEVAGAGGSPQVEVDVDSGTARMRYRVRFRPAGDSVTSSSVTVSLGGPEDDDPREWIRARRADDGLWYVTLDLVARLDDEAEAGA